MKNKVTYPLMGFNSWDCYGAAINEEQLLSIAEYVKGNMADFGYKYIVCDIQWYEPKAKSTQYNNFTELCVDDYSRVIPAVNRFPSSANGVGFKAIADKIHDMGLLFGIHIMRGIPRQCVHQNTPTVTPGVTARNIASSFSVCPWNTDMYGINHNAKGAQEYYDSIFEMYASWGIDFVKVDDIANTEYKPHDPYSAKAEIEMIAKAIQKTGRHIILSLSPGPAPINHASHLSEYANMWRMSGDFWDESKKLDEMFELCYKWYEYIEDDSRPDCDMLPLGVLCLNDENEKHRARNSRFTKSEQEIVMGLWCMFRSPLFFGGDPRFNDEFTLKLVTNENLISLQNSSKNNRPLFWNKKQAIWYCDDKNGNSVYGFFNLEDDFATIITPFNEVAEGLNLISNKYENIGKSIIIPARSCKIFRVK
jgi:hypothetical protein